MELGSCRHRYWLLLGEETTVLVLVTQTTEYYIKMLLKIEEESQTLCAVQHGILLILAIRKDLFFFNFCLCSQTMRAICTPRMDQDNLTSAKKWMLWNQKLKYTLMWRLEIKSRSPRSKGQLSFGFEGVTVCGQRWSKMLWLWTVSKPANCIVTLFIVIHFVRCGGSSSISRCHTSI